MKKFFACTAILAVVLYAAILFGLNANAQQGIRGPFMGDVWVPSAFNLIFGDLLVAADDVYLKKNGANNLGVTGHIGGPGSTANTTTTPGNFAWGVVTLAANTATVTFSKPFVVAPVCIATDQTTAQLVKAAPTATTVVLSDTVGATDVVAYFCVGNPN